MEGLGGGRVAGIATGLAFGLLAGAALAQLPALALVAFATVLFSVVGDLFESLLMRPVDAKDPGTVNPGLGDNLDRLDRLPPALPVSLHGKELLGFGNDGRPDEDPGGEE